MLKTVVAVFVVLAFAVAPTFASPVTVQNNSFENCGGSLPGTACALGSNGFNTTLLGWTISAGTTPTGTGGTAGTFQPTYVAGPPAQYIPAQDGVDVAFVYWSSNISQTLGISVTPGQQYNATVYLGVQAQGTSSVPYTVGLFTTSAGANTGTIATASGSVAPYTGSWTPVFISGVATTSGTLTIEIDNTDGLQASPNLLVDNVSVSSAPEPATFSLLVFGAALVAGSKIRARMKA